MSNRTKRRIVTIVTLLVLMVGSINVLEITNKIVKTSVELITISDNISFYNDTARKTDSMTKQIEDMMEHREKNFYQSEDWTVRTFSNMFVLIKIVVLVTSLAMYILIPYMWVSVIRNLIRREQRRRKMLSKKGAK